MQALCQQDCYLLRVALMTGLTTALVDLACHDLFQAAKLATRSNDMMEKKANRDRNKYESRLLELMSNQAVLDFSCELILRVLNSKEICFRLDVLARQSELSPLSKEQGMNFAQHLVDYYYYGSTDFPQHVFSISIAA